MTEIKTAYIDAGVLQLLIGFFDTVFVPLPDLFLPLKTRQVHETIEFTDLFRSAVEQLFLGVTLEIHRTRIRQCIHIHQDGYFGLTSRCSWQFVEAPCEVPGHE
uniref:Uncharacterized protein n=1 Tax=Fusarium oxysporum (strain Fo5176) TaxID=660025 RepID=A0A0D2YET5_FUSOF